MRQPAVAKTQERIFTLARRGAPNTFAQRWQACHTRSCPLDFLVELPSDFVSEYSLSTYMTDSPRQRASGTERRAQIIAATLDLSATQGPARVSAQAIADRIGVAQPTIFRHFPSRDAIFSATLDWASSNLFLFLRARDRPAAPADERLHDMLRGHLEFVSRHPGLPRLLFSDRLHGDDPALRKAVGRTMQRYVDHIAGLLQAGAAQGRFRADLLPKETAALILALVQGLLLRWSVFDFNDSLVDQFPSLWRHLSHVLYADDAMGVRP